MDTLSLSLNPIMSLFGFPLGNITPSSIIVISSTILLLIVPLEGLFGQGIPHIIDFIC